MEMGGSEGDSVARHRDTQREQHRNDFTLIESYQGSTLAEKLKQMQREGDAAVGARPAPTVAVEAPPNARQQKPKEKEKEESKETGKAVATTNEGEDSTNAPAVLNPMIVLAHFCELHGPSVLLCTQLIRATPWQTTSATVLTPPSTPSKPSKPSSTSASSPHDVAKDEQQKSEVVGTSTPRQGRFGSTQSKRSTSPTLARWGFPLSPPAGASFTFSSSNSPVMKVSAASSAILPTDSIKQAGSASGGRSTPACPSCNALPSDSGFFSVDDNSGTYYITTRYPSATYARIRTASVRALSCEFSPGREGPMFFGDEENGFCLSYVFKVHDFQARGFVRWYGILFLAPHADLLASTDFLVQSIKGMVKDLQDQSATIMEREREEKEKLAQATQASSTPSSSAFHLRTNFPTGPGAFRRRQIHANAPLRGLDTLLNDQKLSSKMHTSFAWILQQWESQHLASPFRPFAESASTSRLPSSRTASINTGDVTPRSANSAEMGPSSPPVFSYLSVLAHEDHDVQQIRDMVAQHELVFESFQQLMHALGPTQFNSLLHNVLCGNQVIVRGDCRPLVASVLVLLTELVPERCVKLRAWETEEYHESWKFNFLGLSSQVSVPDYISGSAYALVDIIPNPRSRAFGPSAERQQLAEATQMPTAPQGDQITPTTLSSALSPQSSANAWTAYRYECQAKMEQALGTLPAEIIAVMGLHLARPFEQQRIQSIKHAWSSKAKAFFTVSKLMQHEKDVRLITFLNSTGLIEADLPVLRYWTTGLRHDPGFLRLIGTQQSTGQSTSSVPFTSRRPTFATNTLLQQGSSSFSRTASIYSAT